MLQTSQNRAIRSIFREQYYAHGLSTEQIRNVYGILSVRRIIKFNTATHAYKTENNLIKTDIAIHHTGDRHNYSTRKADNIYQSSFRSNTGKFSTSRMIAVEYNSLPNHIKSSVSLNIFKKKLKTHLFVNHAI